MAKIISASIDLTKIDKSKIKTTDKNGVAFKNDAKYLEIQIVINDEVNEYGQDASIRINQSKEERELKEKPIYLGNGKTVWDSAANNVQVVQAEVITATTSNDDLPF
jgi:hypothetical protein